jgi:hypothetical protein
MLNLEWTASLSPVVCARSEYVGVVRGSSGDSGGDGHGGAAMKTRENRRGREITSLC